VPGYRIKRDTDGTPFVFVRAKGRALLTNAMYNKGTAFTPEERRHFRLEGMLPSAVSSPESQLTRAYQYVKGKGQLLEQYYSLAGIQDRNETLFYRMVLEHLEEFAPVVYRPVAALASQHFCHTFRLGRGLWITPEHEGRVERVLGHTRYQDIRLIVVTDNERCCGLGDRGAGGICVPIGKLVMYTVAAGIHPTQMLPVSLDVGTDSRELLDDPLYLGWRHRRLRGEQYDRLVEEFVTAVQKRFPRALLQWEDFGRRTALMLLDRYRDRLPSFSDDVQGTAAAALAGILSYLHASQAQLRDQRVLICGAGVAGIGLARLLRVALARAGLLGSELTGAVAVLDSRGLLVKGRSGLREPKADQAWTPQQCERARLPRDAPAGLQAMVEAYQPTVLVGASGQAGLFSERVVRALDAGCERPLVLLLSSPASRAEAQPKQIVRWTSGRALVATWNPATTVSHGDRTIRVSQGDSTLLVPAVALGALVADASHVSDAMLVVAAEALASTVPRSDVEQGELYPPLGRLRSLTARMAVDVALEAAASGAAAEVDEETLRNRVAEVWRPAYVDLRLG
jgi:malic enzyme